MKNNTKKDSNPKLNLNKDAEKIKRLESVLKETENKFKEAESIARFGFWEIDPLTLDPTWTDGLFKIVGYDPECGELNHYYDQKKIIHPDDWEYFYNATKTVITTGEDIEFDIRVIKPDGSICILYIIAKPKNDESGKVTGVGYSSRYY